MKQIYHVSLFRIIMTEVITITSGGFRGEDAAMKNLVAPNWNTTFTKTKGNYEGTISSSYKQKNSIK